MDTAEILARIEQHLARIADAIDSDRPAPAYRAPLPAYPAYDWTAIDATVVESDEYGATHVLWRGREYVRRTNAKYGPGLWFSRGAGRDEEGNPRYDRLISFVVHTPVEDLPRAVRDALQQAGPVVTRTASASSHSVTTPAPADDHGPDYEDGREPDPLDAAFPRAASPQEEADAKRSFYATLSRAVAAGQLSPAEATTASRNAAAAGFVAALADLADRGIESTN